MKTLRWFAIVTLIGGASLIACGSDDEGGSSGGSGGGTAGTGGSTAGTGGGTAGTGGGSAGEAGMAGSAGEAGSAGMAGSAGTAGSGGGGSAACVAACIEANPTEWVALIDAVAPCVCAAGLCDTICADSYCADPISYEATEECLSCGLEQGQANCMAQLAGCATSTCATIAPCLLGCSS